MLDANSYNKKRKKRKVEDEHLESPLPKHKLKTHDHESSLPEYQLVQQQQPLGTCANEGKTEMEFSNGVAQHMESVTDSNSLAGETDSATSLYPDGRFKPEFPKVYAYDHPSTSSTSCSSNNSSSTDCFLSSSRDDKDNTTSSDRSMNLEAVLQFQLGNTEYPGLLVSGIDQHEQCSDDVDIEDIMLDADIEEPNTYVLSSGRWSINRDNRFSSKKPTIDEEFEQYFSMLML